MKTLNTIIEEEILKEFDEMPFGVTIPFNQEMMWGEVKGFQADGREEFKEWLRGQLTTATQRAYEAGRKEEGERVVQFLKENGEQPVKDLWYIHRTDFEEALDHSELDQDKK